MRRYVLPLTLLLPLAGCQALTKKHDNPVLQPPPRRMSANNAKLEEQYAEASNSDKTSDITLASKTDEVDDDTQIFNATIVAKVNGAPIFAGDVLDRYGEHIVAARKKLPPEEFRKFREALIQRDLRGHIERRLLVERMRSSLKPDQLKQFEQHLDQQFEAELTKLKKDLNAYTRTELELALRERESSLSAVRDAFATNQAAMEYVSAKIERPAPPTRPDLVAYYQEHLDDYALPAKVKWQQIQVSWDGRTTKSSARKKIQEAQHELQQGATFEAVVKKYSDGPTVSDGGHWDWTQIGSLAETKLETLLFEMPVNQPSDIWEGKSSYQIVRVTDRQKESRRPFSDVQDEIFEKITLERRKNLPQEFVKKLYDSAIIETPYKLAE